VDENLVVSVLLVLFGVSRLAVLSYSLKNIFDGSLCLFNWPFQRLGGLASIFSPEARSAAHSANIDIGGIFMLSGNHGTQGLGHSKLALMRCSEAMVDIFAAGVAHEIISTGGFVWVMRDIERIM